MQQKKQKWRRIAPKNILMLLLDAVLINVASWGALYLRGLDATLEAMKKSGFFHTLELCCVPCTIIALIVLALFGVYRVVWEYAGQRELMYLGGACVISAAGLYLQF